MCTDVLLDIVFVTILGQSAVYTDTLNAKVITCLDNCYSSLWQSAFPNGPLKFIICFLYCYHMELKI